MNVFTFCSSVSSTTVHWILRDRKLHPYKYVRVQHLHAGDYIQRVQYSRWLLGEVLRNPSFTKYILWTDEELFNREEMCGATKIPSASSTCSTSPLVDQPMGRHLWQLYRWAVHILPDRLDGPAYKYYLEHVLPDLMDNIPYDIRQNTYYQHDGAVATLHLECPR